MTHTHTHPHEHVHAHAHPHEHVHTPQAAAVLDIGGSVGALLVQCPAELDGVEIQLYDLSGSLLTHTQVHRRTPAGTPQYSGLFPALTAGEYRVELRAGGPHRPARVAGGKVTVLDAR